MNWGNGARPVLGRCVCGVRGRANGSLLHACALMAHVLFARGSHGRPLGHLFGSSPSGAEHRSKDARDDRAS